MSDSEQKAAPVLRLTGEQIGSIEPPLDGDWFVDFDEYEEFVPKRMYDALAAARVSGDPQGLREALGKIAAVQPSEFTDVHRLVRIARAALAPIPADPADWTALANDIRIVDGNHDLGAGELAERLVERGWRKAAGDPAGLREAARLLVDWIEDGGDALAYPIASGLDALRAALAPRAPASTENEG